MLTVKCRSKLWLYQGPGGWHFITLPAAAARQIKSFQHGERKGWGAVQVHATIGETTWKTSIFPDRKSKSYLLPVKADVRKREDIGDKDLVSLILEVMI
jgi:hypothetical protein